MNFKMNTWAQNREKPKQTFGNPKLKRAGQELDVRTWIEEGREDTEIYPTLEKYGCIDKLIVNTQQVYGDLTEILDLRSSIEQIKKADELWKSLPLDMRKEFLGDKKRFMEEGLDWLKKKIEKEKEEIKPATKPVQTTQPTVEAQPKEDN